MARVSAAYLLAFVTATAWLAWGPDSGRLWLDALTADGLATLVVFAASRWHHNSSFYDPYWSVLPPYVAGFWVIASDGAGDAVRAALVLLVVALWAVRLTANWVIGFPGLHHEDWRYPMLRDRAGRWELPVDLLAIHLIPTVQVFLGRATPTTSGRSASGSRSRCSGSPPPRATRGGSWSGPRRWSRCSSAPASR